MDYLRLRSDPVDELRAVIAAKYPDLEVIAEVEIAVRGPSLIVASAATEALVSDAGDLERWFGRGKQVSRLIPSGKTRQTLLF